jgi:hypothetical protein
MEGSKSKKKKKTKKKTKRKRAHSYFYQLIRTLRRLGRRPNKGARLSSCSLEERESKTRNNHSSELVYDHGLMQMLQQCCCVEKQDVVATSRPNRSYARPMPGQCQTKEEEEEEEDDSFVCQYTSSALSASPMSKRWSGNASEDTPSLLLPLRQTECERSMAISKQMLEEEDPVVYEIFKTLWVLSWALLALHWRGRWGTLRCHSCYFPTLCTSQRT